MANADTSANVGERRHDPLCPLPECDYGKPRAECYGYEDCRHYCQCALIAKVRADEREKAIERVSNWVPVDFNSWEAFALRWAAFAIRGESS